MWAETPQISDEKQNIVKSDVSSGLSRERLLDLTHSESMAIFDRTIDVLVMRLRRKIEQNPHQPTLIRTIRGVGYDFAADIIQEEHNAA